ncbi:MAG: tyrosine--tRNA ligase [Candidatus Marinimicrobia bacterium]|nr:tyrosine--tRNA ligase [Candidatus Neomarinimicrobiota bacterium]|tara:strand:+ start:8465 stop:9670 length:1206 start_codon:yes stop_codon:yes gene_type:complete
MKFKSLEEQLYRIKRGVEEILPESELVEKIEKSLSTNIPLNIKLGCDPSRPDLHLGHSVVLNKMKDFQDLGHNVTLVIGDFTAMIGDPTGRNKTRPQLDMKTAKINADTYIKQASKILDVKKLRVVYNSEWLSKLNFSKIINISGKFTIAQFLDRDDFSKRYKSGVPISIHEFMYPLAQGYDSVVLRSDIEIGGTDQKFNLLLGRDLQREYNLSPQIAIMLPILEGTDGKMKMSKSYDNYISFNDKPNDMYGKVMSIPDELLLRYYMLTTNIDLKEIEDYKLMLDSEKITYRDLKRKLSREIISIYYDNDIASQAEQHFIDVFVKKVAPDDIEVVKVNSNIKLIDFLHEQGLVQSKGECKRLIKQSAIKFNDVVVSDVNYEIQPSMNAIIKVGKRKFIKIA